MSIKVSASHKLGDKAIAGLVLLGIVDYKNAVKSAGRDETRPDGDELLENCYRLFSGEGIEITMHDIYRGIKHLEATGLVESGMIMTDTPKGVSSRKRYDVIE